MKKSLSEKSFKIIKKMQQSELTESYIYEAIAKSAKGERNKEVLLTLSAEERSHYEVWKTYTDIEMKPQRAKVLFTEL